jgi:hypothetical protein
MLVVIGKRAKELQHLYTCLQVGRPISEGR